MAQEVNLLAASVLGQEHLRAQLLLDRLSKSCSTWELHRPGTQNAIPDSDQEEVVRAVDEKGNQYVSHKEIGLSELLSSVWIRKRVELGCDTTRLIAGHGLEGEQELAARMLLSEPVSCLSGLPGTGKTHTMKAVYESFVRSGKAVALTAFTGAAASRLGDSVGGTGLTIHRLLGFNRSTFKFNDSNKLEIDVCIIDESGMLSSVLLWCLLRALYPDTVVIFVGDPYQLPSVESGYVLGDLIEVLPHFALKTIRRSNPDGPIGIAASHILKGEIPPNAEGKGDGFYQIPCDDIAWHDDKGNSHSIYEKMWLIAKRMSNLHGINLPEVRVMCPTNNAVDLYNSVCMERYQGPIPFVALANNPESGYFNGDIGYLLGDEIVFDSSTSKLNGRERYNKSVVGKLYKPAFATTVYKMQGREAVACALLLPRKNGGFPRRSEVYTAITRAKNRCCVVGNLAHFAAAIRKPEPRRLTLFRELISQRAEVL